MLSFPSLVKSFALLLGLILAVQDFHSFFIEQPTTAVLDSRQAKFEEYPDFIFCPNPGYNLKQLEHHGFKGFEGFLFGIMEGERDSVNFNGKFNIDPENITKDIILVEKLEDIVDKIVITLIEDPTYRGTNVVFREIVKEGKDIRSERVLTRTGFCFRIIKSGVNQGNWTFKNLRMYFNSENIEQKNITKIYIKFEEIRNHNRLLKLSPFDMTGDKLVINQQKGTTKRHLNYKIQIKKFERKKYCKTYGDDNSEDICNEQHAQVQIKNTLGCLPFCLTKGSHQKNNFVL